MAVAVVLLPRPIRSSEAWDAQACRRVAIH